MYKNEYRLINFFSLQSSPVIVKEALYTSIVNIKIGRSVSYFGTIGVTFIVSAFFLSYL